jgi:choline-sulfatase
MPLADMPDRYRRMYHPDDVQLRGNVDPDALAAGDGFYRSLDEVFRTYLWDYRDYYNQMPHSQRLPEGFGIRDLMALYYGAITWVDDTLGRVLQTLEQTGQADDTLVVFTADHGDNFASHGRFGKGQLLEESCRIPMAWQGPGVQPQHWDAGVASLVDLAPTLLDAAGVDIPDHMHGRSLQPMLTGTGDGPAEAYIESGGDGVGVRTPTHLFGLPWTGGENPGPREIDPAGKPHRFHDFNADPLQQHSISPADAPELADDLRERLTSWHANTPWRTSPAAQPV